MKLKKGSIAAKRFMAKIRAKKKSAKKVTKKPARKKMSGIYDSIKRQGIKAKKNVAYSVIDKTLKSANNREKASLKKAKKVIQNTYLGSNLHKDTKSHNVRISVMSGINNETLEILKMTISKLTYWEKELIRLKAELKLSKDQYEKNGLRLHIKRVKEIITFNKKHITTLKKLIK